MNAAADQNRLGLMARLTRKRWWFLVSTVAPVLTAAALVLWMAREFSAAQTELNKMTVESAALRSETERLKAELAALARDKQQLEMDLGGDREKLEALKLQVTTLTKQRDLLEVAVSSPESADAIAKVLSVMAALSPRERAKAMKGRGDEVWTQKPDLATQFYQAAIREDSSYAPPMLSLGLQAANRKDFREAEKQYTAAAAAAEKGDPDNYGWALLYLLNLALIEGRLDKAGKYAEMLKGPGVKQPQQTADALERLERAKARQKKP